MHCKTHGQSFQATGGMPLTADETFLAAERESIAIRIKEMKDDKDERIAAEKREQAALTLIEQEKADSALSGQELDVLLKWHKVKLTSLKKAQKLALWKDIKEKKPRHHHTKSGHLRTRKN